MEHPQVQRIVRRLVQCLVERRLHALAPQVSDNAQEPLIPLVPST
jgi:hypothetical protein